MARIAIVGVGAIGGVIAALLQQTGRHELVLCARRPLKDLVVETPDGSVPIHFPILTDPGDAPHVDWVLVATKAYDVAAAAKWLARFCGRGAPVAVLQNGVEHRERFAPYVPMPSILPVIVECPVERPSPERIRQRGAMHLRVPEGALGGAFVELFSGSLADVVEVPDFLTVAWRKLCHNAVGALPTLVLQPAGILRGEAMGEVALQLVRECIAVGNAEGAHLDAAVAEEVLAAYRRSAPDGINSMHADRLAGRPLEIDARNGAIVRKGRQHGIPTPANSMAVALLEAMTAQR